MNTNYWNKIFQYLVKGITNQSLPMINFFRKIRKKLADDNKPLKYMRYAIGEIALVVVGILIALQINNWSKKQEDGLKEKEYLVLLTNEMKSEVQYFRELKDDFSAIDNSLKRITKLWQSNNGNIKDSIQYLIDYGAAGLKDPWYTEPVTWTLLQQTGDLTLIKDNSLKMDLFTYYSNVRKTADNYLQYPMSMIKRGREMMAMPFNNDSKNLQIISGYAQEHLAKEEVMVYDFDKNIFITIWENRNDLSPIYVYLSGVSNAQVTRLEPIIKTGEELLGKLEAAQGITTE